jgi:hypothetical protein
MWFKPARFKVAEFCEGRSRQSHDDFAGDCGLKADPDAAVVAIAVRRVIGELGLVNPEYIRADDAFPYDLGVLPLWDSMDWVAFALALEEELGVKDIDEALDCIMDLSHCTVRELVAGIVRVLDERKQSTPKNLETIPKEALPAEVKDEDLKSK